MHIDLEICDVPADEGRVRSYLNYTLREALGVHASRFERAEVRIRRHRGGVECALRLYARHADAA